MYSIDMKVKFSEAAKDMKMNIYNIMEAFQECSVEQSEAVGNGALNNKFTNKVWLLLGWDIEVKRYPKFMETVKINTMPRQFHAMLGYRDFEMLDADGDIIAKAHSIWILYDSEKMRISKVSKEMEDAYGVDECELDSYYTSCKIFPKADYENETEIKVKRSDLDFNGHVNNVVYGRYIMDALDTDMRPKHMKIYYKKAAVMGDVLTMCVGENCAELKKGDEIITLYEFRF